MPAYRVYQVNGSGKFSVAKWVAADSDAEAIAYAREKWPFSNSEVWERDRLVARIAADEPDR